MKKVILFISILTLLGCIDDTQTNDDGNNNNSTYSIIGQWERTYQIGDMSGIALLSFNSNYVTTATFSGNTLSGTYNIINNNITVFDNECPGIAGNYNYSIIEGSNQSMTPTTLIFTLINDECGEENGRANFMANQSTAIWSEVN